jgi:hypothetical protein
MLRRRGLEKKFVVKLEEFQAKKAADISDLCYSGYKSFVISVRISDSLFIFAFKRLSFRWKNCLKSNQLSRNSENR